MDRVGYACHMAEFKLSLLGLDKLIEVVAQGIGALAKPWMIRRVSKARADSMKILASAEAGIAQQLQLPPPTDASKETGGELPKLLVTSQSTDSAEAAAELFEKRIEQRIMLREQRRQRNIEAIALEAAQEIVEVETVSDEPVDDAWIDRFFQAAQDVGDPELRRLWARILAREVAAPKSTPLRTLEVLRNLTAAEARLFQECLRIVCDMGDGPVFLIGRNSVVWMNRLLMVDCGLIGLETICQVESGKHLKFTHGDAVFVMRAKSAAMFKGWTITVIHLSEAGKAVCAIMDRSKSFDRQFVEGLIEAHEKHFDLFVQEGERELSLREFLARSS